MTHEELIAKARMFTRKETVNLLEERPDGMLNVVMTEEKLTELLMWFAQYIYAQDRRSK